MNMYSNDSLVEAAATMPHWFGMKSPRDPIVLEALRRVDRKKFLNGHRTCLGTGDIKLMKDIQNEGNNLRLVYYKRKVEGRKEEDLTEEEKKEEREICNKLLVTAFNVGDTILYAKVSAKALAYNDTTILIGEGQTCSMPSLVALMSDLLELKTGMNVLEIGTGCGYHAAITYELIKSGKLTTIEFNPKLAKKGRKNLERHLNRETENVHFVHGDGSIGYLPNAPYDRIYLTAAPQEEGFNPQPFIDQLNNDDGILLYPTEYDHNLNLVRILNGTEERKSFFGVSFVPLLGENSGSSAPTTIS